MDSDLTKHFLIATPQLKNSIFSGSVIYMIDHDAQGACGIIINRLLDIKLSLLFPHLQSPFAEADRQKQTQAHKQRTKNSGAPLTIDAQTASNTHTTFNEQFIYFGGPVASNRGFVLHSNSSKSWDNTININDDIALTTSHDIIDDIARNQGPDKLLIALGYTGWSSKQLDLEMRENTWLAVPASGDIIFSTSCENRLEHASHNLGIDLSLLMPQLGHA